MAEYILIKKDSQRSHQNGVTMWRLTFYCIDDGTVWEMTVDATYRNFRKKGWDHVVESDCPWAVYGNLKRTERKTREGVGVVSADSLAEVIYRCTDQQQALDLVQAAEDLNQQRTTFQEFFQ